jgi:sporulation protein YlmC with PRC-barrel domain
MPVLGLRRGAISYAASALHLIVSRTAERDIPFTSHLAAPYIQESSMNTSQSSSDVISSDRVEGADVFNDAGDKLGSIDDLMIDKRSGQVRYAVLEFGGFLGMGTDRYPLPWDMLKYDTSKEGYVVPLDKERLKGAPSYSEENRPEYDDSYGRRVNDYYGVPYL